MKGLQELQPISSLEVQSYQMRENHLYQFFDLMVHPKYVPDTVRDSPVRRTGRTMHYKVKEPILDPVPSEVGRLFRVFDVEVF